MHPEIPRSLRLCGLVPPRAGATDSRSHRSHPSHLERHGRTSGCDRKHAPGALSLPSLFTAVPPGTAVPRQARRVRLVLPKILDMTPSECRRTCSSQLLVAPARQGTAVPWQVRPYPESHPGHGERGGFCGLCRWGPSRPHDPWTMVRGPQTASSLKRSARESWGVCGSPGSPPIRILLSREGQSPYRGGGR